jgi:hypothetical protein
MCLQSALDLEQTITRMSSTVRTIIRQDFGYMIPNTYCRHLTMAKEVT